MRINYLINDVYYLKMIFNKFKDKLSKNKKLKSFNKLIKKEIFKISHEDYPVIYKKKLGKNILNNRKFIKIINLRNKIAEKINLPKNWIFSDKEIIKNILPRYGIEVTFVDGKNINEWKKSVKKNTKIFRFSNFFSYLCKRNN